MKHFELVLTQELLISVVLVRSGNKMLIKITQGKSVNFHWEKLSLQFFTIETTGLKQRAALQLWLCFLFFLDTNFTYQTKPDF